MKIFHLTIIFSVIAAVFFSIAGFRAEESIAMARERRRLDTALDQAVVVGSSKLISASGKTSEAEREEAAEAFYGSLYASFSIMDAPQSMENVKNYVPVIAVPDTDGFYILYTDSLGNNDGTGSRGRHWSEKICYSYGDGTFIYRFTNGTEVTIYDENNILTFYDGSQVHKLDVAEIDRHPLYESILEKCPSSILLDRERFISIRDKVISEKLEEYLNYYCSVYDRVARQSGVSYGFRIPDMDNMRFVRDSKGIGMMAFFQGFRYTGSSRVYNRFSFANAGIKTAEVFLLGSDNIYHRQGCKHTYEAVEVLYSEGDCAERGAFACRYCCPDTGVHRA